MYSRHKLPLISENIQLRKIWALISLYLTHHLFWQHWKTHKPLGNCCNTEYQSWVLPTKLDRSSKTCGLPAQEPQTGVWGSCSRRGTRKTFLHIWAANVNALLHSTKGMVENISNYLNLVVYAYHRCFQAMHISYGVLLAYMPVLHNQSWGYWKLAPEFVQAFHSPISKIHFNWGRSHGNIPKDKLS